MNAKMAWALVAATLMVSCTEDPEEEQGLCSEGPRVLALGTKYGKPGSSSLDLIGCGKVQADEPAKGMPAQSDVGIDLAGGNVFLLDKQAGALTGFVGSDLSKAFLDQSVGASGNPYGVARLGDHLWVARYGSTHLLGIPFGGAKADSIDLSMYADTSSRLPRMMAAKVWSGKIVVGIQRLDKSFGATDSGLVLVIDPSTKKVEKRIALPYRNPDDVDLRGDLLAVGCTGGWASSKDGGLAVVDLAKGAVTTSISADSLGGDPSRVAFVSSDRVWVALDFGYPTTKARPVDLSSGKLGSYFTEATAVGDLAFDGASLWVANHDDASPKVYRVDPATGSRTGDFATRLAPGQLLVLP